MERVVYSGLVLHESENKMRANQVNDSKVTIREYLQKADKDLTVTAFRRLQLGA